MRVGEICFVDTSLLRVGYLCGGPANGRPLLLLHGWPDDATTYDTVAAQLQRAGYRTYAPWLRGFGPTRFLDDSTFRSGEIAAFAQDAVDFADALGLERFDLVGHDWGARAAGVISATHPHRLRHCALLSYAWQPGNLATPALPQLRAFWYQWFMATDRGKAFVSGDRKSFAREMWDTWSPPGWFSDEQFAEVAKSFENPDWPAVTVHSYRVRWQEADPDPRYAVLTARHHEVRSIEVPVLLLQGGDDRAVLPASTEGKEIFYSGGYRREVLDRKSVV